MNQNYKLIVSEPWDFKGPLADNVILGIVRTRVSSKCIIFEASAELEFRGVSSTLLLLLPRFSGEEFPEKLVPISVNIGLITAEPKGMVEEKTLLANFSFVAVGSLQKSEMS